MIINFGKYSGYSLEEIFKKDAPYLEWLCKNTDKVIIKNECLFLLNYKADKNKIEKIVFESLLSRGYSETESNMFISKLKDKN